MSRVTTVLKMVPTTLTPEFLQLALQPLKFEQIHATQPVTHEKTRYRL